ncbi:MAG: GAF domain-containing protein [Solirubrobacterales bacterium]|nr:GAF domain-containing protein [Solirubrobacterales bacterium]
MCERNSSSQDDPTPKSRAVEAVHVDCGQAPNVHAGHCRGDPRRRRSARRVTGSGSAGNIRIERQIAPAHPDTVEVLAGLIAELDSATEAGEFYDDVCEALCRLTSMRRAGILLYDPATRAVRFVGSHGIDREIVGEIEGTLDETPLAQRALAEDRVVEASEHLEREVPERYARYAGATTLTCTPVAAGGRWLGIILADRGGGHFAPSDEERQTMLTLGRLAALAASVERATRQDERAHRLAERIGLVREIHDRVMQRLFGLVLVFGSGEALSAEERRACHDELQTVLGDLRSALGRPLGSREPTRADLRSVIERRAERTPELAVDWPAGIEVPERLEELAQSVFVEALRNCEKHARPTRIEVSLASTGDAFELEIANDGTGSAGPGAGLGLRLLTLEALQQDALVEFGPLPDGGWRVRMVGAVE